MPARKKPQPVFESQEQEAEFWDSHSPLDYGPEPKLLKVIVKAPKDRVITIRLDSKYRAKLEELATVYHLGPSTLARFILSSAIDQWERGKRRPSTVPLKVDHFRLMDWLATGTPHEPSEEMKRLLREWLVRRAERPGHLLLTVPIEEELAREWFPQLAKAWGYKVEPGEKSAPEVTVGRSAVAKKA